ncbi:type VII secretion integral membrane protein EccD [Haloechinothrix halophila]|uniref:Type VII secretion integral membrane protein EccD n=1 Tax=Haloechinothrix halophila YIM 93223 TaxID=592678 RepID=W9DLX2_9PSEU|nr:type VII secretion integral membrane protein EccD [Haloechinothrix halophila]ETA66384.1 type VII secretion integral membrane protein EccD [Haloechinothrix halophila YIM 93223]
MATSTTVFSRVTVVAPRTRIDVALPADVAVADILPLVVEMANERSADGGSSHGGWVLAKLGDAPLDPSRTLASLGVVDGDLLQLRKRNENPPPPLFDDVVDAIAEAKPDNFRPWTPETAKRAGHIAGGLALAVAAVALFMGGTLWGGSGLTAAIVGGIGAIGAVALGAVLAQAYNDPETGVVVAATGGLPLAFVSGFYTVPGVSMTANLLLGSVWVVIVAAASIMLIGHGISAFIAAATAGTLGAVTFLFALFIDQPPAGFASAAAAVSLGLISALPRATLLLAKLPSPVVPSSAEELKQDSAFPDFGIIERRTTVAHQYMTGLLVGCGAIVAISAVIASSSATWYGIALAVAATLALLLRARTYANGSQAIALLTMGVLASAGIMIGWTMTADWSTRLIWIFTILIVMAAGALVVGVIFPHQRFSPPLRRTVEIIEAICIAVVLPLALGVLGLYSELRSVGSSILG